MTESQQEMQARLAKEQEDMQNKSDPENGPGDTPEEELVKLKRRADLVGMKYHPKIGLDTLKTNLDEFLKSGEGAPDPTEVLTDNTAVDKAEETGPQKRVRLRREAELLVRVEISCMNPGKKEWEGEIVSVSNSVIGTIKKYIPYNVPYHVPTALLNVLKERKCQIFETKRDNKGNKSRQGKLIKEFGINMLDPLSQQELEDLAQRQRAQNTIGQ